METTLEYILKINERKRCPECNIEMYYTGRYYDLAKPMLELKCSKCDMTQVESLSQENDDHIDSF